MENVIELSGYQFEFNPEIEGFCDEKNSRIAFISKGYDEIHLIIEIKDGRVLFHPRWNIRIETVEGSSKKYYIGINFPDELMNLDDLPMKE